MDLNQYEIYKKMPSFQRVTVGCQLHDFAYQRLKLFLRQQMNNATEAMIQEEILKRFLGESKGIFYRST
jgi:hypothetical protein